MKGILVTDEVRLIVGDKGVVSLDTYDWDDDASEYKWGTRRTFASPGHAAQVIRQIADAIEVCR